MGKRNLIVKQAPVADDPTVYLLLTGSPANMFSRIYSQVYNLLDSLFGEDPILEDDAIEALSSLELNAEQAASALRVMTKYRYLHRTRLSRMLDE